MLYSTVFYCIECYEQSKLLLCYDIPMSIFTYNSMVTCDETVRDTIDMLVQVDFITLVYTDNCR